ncbi:MAG: arsenic efflux protein [Kiritimatiellae bacterium]|nr:arsenic efflux protein [Kiritimatiellia bacterium]
MTEFILETLALLPFLFVTFLILEAVEARANGALERFLERSRSVGPFAGGVAGAIPQCGVSAAAASFYAGGVISVGTLLAVFLSTSDELMPVLLSSRMPAGLMMKIVLLKVAFAIAVGFTANGILAFFRHRRRPVSVEDLCKHSRCRCHGGNGIFVSALIHTAEIFLFIVIVSGAIELTMHYFGEDSLQSLRLTRPVFGEIAAGAVGMIPNCAVSVAGAELYMKGAMSPGALMASSFAGSGLGLLVLFRTNRNLRENILILLTVYVTGVILGMLAGPFIGPAPAAG